jgi:hypothetical protein
MPLPLLLQQLIRQIVRSCTPSQRIIPAAVIR